MEFEKQNFTVPTNFLWRSRLHAERRADRKKKMERKKQRSYHVRTLPLPKKLMVTMSPLTFGCFLKNN